MQKKEWTYAVEVVAPETSEAQIENWLRQAGLNGWSLASVIVHPSGDLWYHFQMEVGTGLGGRPFDRP